MNTAVDAIPPSRSLMTQALFVGWWIEIAILPLGHLTGLRNAWTVLVVVATFVWLGREAGRRVPGTVPVLLLVAWCGASIAWSTVPMISFGKWQTDLVLPLFAFAAAYGYVRRTGSFAALAGGAVTGIGLLVPLSLCTLVPASALPTLGRVVRLESFPNMPSPLPIWYPGVGDASMAASLVAAVLVVAPRLLPRVARGWWWAGWIAVAVVVALSNNRNAALAIPAVSLGAWWWSRRSGSAPAIDPRRAASWRWTLAVGVLVAAAGLVAVLESSARERLRIIGTPLASDESALLVLTERDTRPMIWTYYAHLAMQSPIIGVGFGRTVPGIHYHTQQDGDLARVEFNAYIHAHNLFLNWWLQTGVVGVALLIAVLVTIVRAALRAVRRSGDPRGRAALVGIGALVALMLIRDATDDFLVYGMATLFWTLLGALVATTGHRDVDEGLIAPRVP